MKKEILVDLGKYKILLNKNIFKDLAIEEYILEHFSTDKIEMSNVIKDIQIMILKELNVGFNHHNDLFNYIHEGDFTSKVVNVIDLLTKLLLTIDVDDVYNVVKFKRYEDKENLKIIVEVEYGE